MKEVNTQCIALERRRCVTGDGNFSEDSFLGKQDEKMRVNRNEQEGERNRLPIVAKIPSNYLLIYNRNTYTKLVYL